MEEIDGQLLNALSSIRLQILVLTGSTVMTTIAHSHAITTNLNGVTVERNLFGQTMDLDARRAATRNFDYELSSVCVRVCVCVEKLS